jgi:hypothetical protein
LGIDCSGPFIRLARFSQTVLYSPAHSSSQKKTDTALVFNSPILADWVRKLAIGCRRQQPDLEIEMRMESKFDSAFLLVPHVDPRSSMFRVIAMTAIIVTFGLLDDRFCCAQSTTTGESRQVPAPWRPAFGALNKNAIPNEDSRRAPIGTGVATSNQASSAISTSTITPGSNSNAGQKFSLNPKINNVDPQQPAQTQTSLQSSARDIKPGVTRVSKTLNTLPNSAGQIWREYDISPYTSQITTNKDPQKSITEWVLRETGTEMWFHQPLGILSADKNRLLVYHTPEIQGIVKSIVDRFNRTRGQLQNIDVNLVTVENPNWRSKLYTMLQPIEVKSPGVEAWMISKENAAILMSQLSRRPDFKQHSGGRIANHDGQAFRLEKTQPVEFVRNLRWVPNETPNYQPLMSRVDEGYRLEISCLSAMDNATIEAVIKCDVDQIEKLSTVKVNVPGGIGTQQMNLQIPQLVSWRLHERFRWPNDQVLLLSCGVVATPEPENNGAGLRIPGLPQKSRRADALLFVEYRGPVEGATVPQTANNRLAPIRTRQ